MTINQCERVKPFFHFLKWIYRCEEWMHRKTTVEQPIQLNEKGKTDLWTKVYSYVQLRPPNWRAISMKLYLRMATIVWLRDPSQSRNTMKIPVWMCQFRTFSSLTSSQWNHSQENYETPEARTEVRLRRFEKFQLRWLRVKHKKWLHTHKSFFRFNK